MISKEHIEFIRLVSNGIEYATAYATIRNLPAINANCRSQGSRLAVKYAKEIAQEKEKARKAVEDANKDKDAQNALKRILTQAEVDAALCEILLGTAIAKKTFCVPGVGTTTVDVTPDHGERLKAIDLYNKRFGSNGAVKVEVQNNLDKLNLYLKRPSDGD
jgi:hypothetical protein